MVNQNTTNYVTTNNKIFVGSTNNNFNILGGTASTYQFLTSNGSNTNPTFGTICNGDFTFGGDAAGITRLFTIQATSTTVTCSNIVAGTSAGDPKTTWGTNVYYSEGVDNSDDDAFVWSQSQTLGTKNVMRISTSGYINYPLQPCFSAYNSATDNNVTGDGTLYTIICDTEVFDQNSDYNNSTGIFTAPVTGKYVFWAGFQLENLSASFTTCTLRITTSNRNYFPRDVSAAAMRDVNNRLSLPATVIADMDVGDTCQLDLTVSGGTKTVNVRGDVTTVYTYFMGKLFA